MRQLQTLLNEKNFQTIDEANVFLSGLRGSSFETVDENTGSNGAMRLGVSCRLNILSIDK
jgi:hypothetical protein